MIVGMMPTSRKYYIILYYNIILLPYIISYMCISAEGNGRRIFVFRVEEREGIAVHSLGRNQTRTPFGFSFPRRWVVTCSAGGEISTETCIIYYLRNLELKSRWRYGV